MEKETQTIEVEVVAIDGIAPIPPTREEPDEQRGSWNEWQNWQGRVRQLDARWWPLWVVLGTVAFVILLTLGLVAGTIYIVYRIIRSVLMGIVSVFSR